MTRFSPLWLQQTPGNQGYAASVDRRLIGALWPAGRTTGLACTAQSGQMVVNVAAGAAAIPAANGTGTVLCVSDATESTELLPAGPTGSHRIDLIIAYVHSAELGAGTGDAWTITNQPGQFSPTPVPPNPQPGTLVLAEVYVPGGSASVISTNITDRRPGYLAIPNPPLGNIGTANGPPTQVDCGNALQNLVTMQFTATRGRKYRVHGFALGQQITAQSTLGQLTMFVGSVARFLFYTNFVPLVPNTWVSGAAWVDVIPNATGPVVATIEGQANAGAMRVRANEANLSVDDIGPA